MNSDAFKIVVASQNPVKLRSVERAFREAFPHNKIDCEGVCVASGVLDQPFGDEETRSGAYTKPPSN